MNQDGNFEWETQEYNSVERSNDWFWAVGIIGLASAILSIIFKNILFGIFILLAVFCVFIFEIKKPRTIKIVISPKGIILGKMYYPYDKLKGYYINEDFNRLYITTDKLVLPVIAINLENMDEEELNDALSTVLPEMKIEVSMTDHVIEKLGF